MAWQKLNISVNTNATIVTVNSGDLTNIKTGYSLIINGLHHEITHIAANQMTLGTAWSGANLSNHTAAVMPTIAPITDMLTEAIQGVKNSGEFSAQLLGQLAELYTSTGNVTLTDGGGQSHSFPGYPKTLADLESWKSNLTPGTIQAEGRYVQTIKIEGSVDYLYPVFWRLPTADFGVGKFQISRWFAWNGAVGERPIHPNQVHQAGLILEFDGMDYPWGGDPEVFNIKYAGYTYAKTASHLRFYGYAYRRSTNSQPPDYGMDGTNYSLSGIYLRGGGLQYAFASNLPTTLYRLPDENDPASELVLHTAGSNTEFYVTRIPMSEMDFPTVTE